MKKSRIFSLVLAVTLCMVMLSSTFMIKTSAAITGSGTESDPYIITSDSDLSKMKGSKSCFKLGQDIYLSSDNWIPINFDGVLDGNGYTLKNYRNTDRTV